MLASAVDLPDLEPESKQTPAQLKPIVDGILSDATKFEDIKHAIDMCPTRVLNKQVSHKYAGQQVLSRCVKNLLNAFLEPKTFSCFF